MNKTDKKSSGGSGELGTSLNGGMSRREFALTIGSATVAIGAAGSAGAMFASRRPDAASGAVHASGGPASHSKESVAMLPAAQTVASAPAAQAAAIPVEVQAQAQVIFSRHGEHLSAEQKSDILRLLGEAHKSSDAMRTFPLENSDEPSPAFRVYVAQGSE